jgi:hypothetical protein
MLVAGTHYGGGMKDTDHSLGWRHAPVFVGL